MMLVLKVWTAIFVLLLLEGVSSRKHKRQCQERKCKCRKKFYYCVDENKHWCCHKDGHNKDCSCKKGCFSKGIYIPVGKRFFDGCNWCVCNSKGSLACTKIFCSTTRKPYVEGCCVQGFDLLPGQRFFDGCNWCTCGLNSVLICTLKFCPEPTDSFVDENGCEYKAFHVWIPEGKTYFDGCNWCTCKNKVLQCTLKDCMGVTEKPHFVNK